MTVENHLRLTDQGLEDAAAQDKRVDLTLWPETAMSLYFQPGEAYSEKLRNFALRNNVNMAFGTLGYSRIGQGRPALFNRLQLISGQGHILGHYDKEHLVPFGEYIPLALDFEFLSNILQGVDFSAGSNQAPLLLPLPEQSADPLDDAYIPPHPKGEAPVVIQGLSDQRGQHGQRGKLALGMLICYEAVFPELAQARVAGGASVLVTVSNDAWFGNTSAPFQHLHLAAMRSVEQHRPMLRDTNTGSTATINALGRITGKTDLFMEAAVLAEVTPSSQITIYHRLHPLPQVVLVVAALALLGLPLLLRLRPGQRPVQHSG
jgi:apolipoprotein N-acyltransferase